MCCSRELLKHNQDRAYTEFRGVCSISFKIAFRTCFHIQSPCKIALRHASSVIRMCHNLSNLPPSSRVVNRTRSRPSRTLGPSPHRRLLGSRRPGRRTCSAVLARRSPPGPCCALGSPITHRPPRCISSPVSVGSAPLVWASPGFGGVLAAAPAVAPGRLCRAQSGEPAFRLRCGPVVTL